MLLSFEVFEETNNVSVSCLFKNHDLLHHLFRLGLFAEMGLIDAFDGYKELCQLLLGKIHFTKGALAQNFTDAIKFDCSWRTLACPLKRVFYVVGQLFNNFFLRGDITFDAFLRFNSVVLRGCLKALTYTVEWYIVNFSCLSNVNRYLLWRLFLGNDLGWLGRLLRSFQTIIGYFCSTQNMFVLFTLDKLARLLRLIAANHFIFWLNFDRFWGTDFNFFVN